MPPTKKPGAGRGRASGGAVTSITYPARRKNLPPAGIEAHGVVREAPAVRYAFNPHLPPVLRASPEPAKADRLPELLTAARRRALTAAEADELAEALRRHEPWLEWSGKREKPWFEVEPVALHMHERVSTQAILRVLARQDVQRNLFADPEHDYAKAVQFYRHDVDWANRMILGDSLQVMASLARREDLAGKVQMIYVDPPYGIRFSSNFQPQLGQRDVKDRQQDLTREPEMVKAYRDTWTLGIHSYLAYLRDRLAMARELLADTGSIFVQMGEENVHLVRSLTDEVFCKENFISQISFRTTTGLGDRYLDSSCNFLLWYAKDGEKVKYREVYKAKGVSDDVGARYRRIETISNGRRPMTSGEISGSSELPEAARVYRHDNLTSQSGSERSSFPVEFESGLFEPDRGFWKTNREGMRRLKGAERLASPTPRTIQYIRFLGDFPVSRYSNVWTDTQTGAFTDDKIYVVQTNTKVVERCLLMTTDPGDLVLDPTCGSGTTAYVAEQWGRRWITIDTSRVALALAKHRLMTAKFDYYRLRDLSAEDVARNPDGTWIAEVDDDGRPTGQRMTFDCRSVPHVTLRSIARNTSLDPIFARHEPILDDALVLLNRVAETVDTALKEKLAGKLVAKHREEGPRAVTDADLRRWLLPGGDPAWIRPAAAHKPLKGLTARQAARYREQMPAAAWKHWQAPFDVDADWPEALQSALTAYREAWRAKMDDVNACIAANAENEELVDQPGIAGGTVRVAGPFSIEGVIAREEGPESPIGGAPDELDAFDADDAGDIAVGDAEAHLDKIIRLLKASGVDFRATRT